MQKRPGYWTDFHKSKSYDINEVKKLIAHIIKETALHGVPYTGGKPKFHLQEHAVLIITITYLGFSYRQMEGMAEAIAGKFIDHSNIGWAMKRISEGYLHKVITMLYLRIEAKCKKGIYIVRFHRHRHRQVSVYVRKTQECVKEDVF